MKVNVKCVVGNNQNLTSPNEYLQLKYIDTVSGT